MHKLIHTLILTLFSLTTLYSSEEDSPPSSEEVGTIDIANEIAEEEFCIEETASDEVEEQVCIEEIAIEEEVCTEETAAIEIVSEIAVEEEPIVETQAVEEIAVVVSDEEESFAEEYLSPEFICEELSLIDEEIEIELAGLKPNQIVAIEAHWIDEDHVRWVSSAKFIANQQGVVNLSTQAPIEGSYEGIDPMGLFWSMEMGHVIIPEYLTARDVPDSCDYSRYIYLLAFDESGEIAEKTICRQILSPEIELIELRENGLIGDLYIPQSEEPLPVVIVLTGSNGGIPSGLAALFASNGIAAFALAYSGVGDLPPNVEYVPLEYFERAFEWVQHHPRLNGKIALHGTSRGAELALLLGSRYPEMIDRIVAVAPSSVVLSRNSWIYKNEPVLPAAPFFIDVNHDYDEHSFGLRENAYAIRIHRERGFLLENERFDAASIAVENIQCPIMLISGGDDQLGPCTFYAKHILKRLNNYHSTIERIHLDYPEAGHFITIPYIPRKCDYFENGGWITVGGAPLADELASRDSWMRTLEFLKK